MKYIRTKYGIYENDKVNTVLLIKLYADNEIAKQYNKGLSAGDLVVNGNEKIIDQSDNLAELCDEFILVAPYRFRRPKTATELEKDFEEMKYFYTDKNDTIYGAIWIELDNGAMRLEPVAKMNEKKELELL